MPFEGGNEEFHRRVCARARVASSWIRFEARVSTESDIVKSLHVTHQHKLFVAYDADSPDASFGPLVTLRLYYVTIKLCKDEFSYSILFAIAFDYSLKRSYVSSTSEMLTNF